MATADSMKIRVLAFMKRGAEAWASGIQHGVNIAVLHPYKRSAYKQYVIATQGFTLHLIRQVRIRKGLYKADRCPVNSSNKI
jgi:hypothetical protein